MDQPPVQPGDHLRLGRRRFLGNQAPGVRVEHPPIPIRDPSVGATGHGISRCCPAGPGGDLRRLILTVPASSSSEQWSRPLPGSYTLPWVVTKMFTERCSHNSSKLTHSPTRLLSPIINTCAPNRSRSRSWINTSNPPRAGADPAGRAVELTHPAIFLERLRRGWFSSLVSG